MITPGATSSTAMTTDIVLASAAHSAMAVPSSMTRFDGKERAVPALFRL
jgi:hypothetical protein